MGINHLVQTPRTFQVVLRAFKCLVMGYKENQRLPREEDDRPPPPYTPSLPPRETEASGSQSTYPTADFSSDNPKAGLHLWAHRDPRNASTDSLIPQQSSRGRRTLLLIYVHGFLGDETSFQSFPAHIHALTTHLLSESHVVHTKIYPKYKSRRTIEFVRDEFSKW